MLQKIKQFVSPLLPTPNYCQKPMIAIKTTPLTNHYFLYIKIITREDNGILA